MKVRALPTCRKPVGEGAKRTRGLSGEAAFVESGIGSQVSDEGICIGRTVLRSVKRSQQGLNLRWYGASESIVKPKCLNDLAANRLIRRDIERRAMYLKPVVFGAVV